MNSIYKLMCVSEKIQDDYESTVEFSFIGGALRVRIITSNGKRYGMAYDFVHSNDIEFNNWIDNIPELFKDLLIKEALGKTTVKRKE
jgi:hypothetical protein